MPRPATTFDPEKQLTIKVKTCQRLVKEVSYYEQEVQENEAKLAVMKAGDRDPYDIKKFEEVLGESYMMIPDSRSRLQKSLDDLSTFLLTHESDIDPEGDWIKFSKSLLEQYGLVSGKVGDDVVVTNVDNLEEGEAF